MKGFNYLLASSTCAEKPLPFSFSLQFITTMTAWVCVCVHVQLMCEYLCLKLHVGEASVGMCTNVQ